jgi:hypothetical protein
MNIFNKIRENSKIILDMDLGKSIINLIILIILGNGNQERKMVKGNKNMKMVRIFLFKFFK